ncbi:alpha/beta hydrolase fold domain-containing protein [uncultured Jannaschia sp.]|uniref:alpha/beta hydrolase fold domain-containing protein n=1 Tax=uncultured Jannaschia sp. TaxID=293347 RepID=UPI0026257D03|nr:alpha/beta hydrolase fold domain-containing protein [uncultured Jannaschia sp.]
MLMTQLRSLAGTALRSSSWTVCLLLAATASAQEADFSALTEAQSALNAAPGLRQVPGRAIPVPTEGVSPAMQALIAAPYSPFWAATGESPDEWRAYAEGASAAAEPALADLREALGVAMEEATMGGVRVFVLTPEAIPEAHNGQVVLNLHGGGYVYGGGVGGTYEATLMAAYGEYRVVAVDYRMPPDAPYPAAVDDAEAVYRALVDEGQDPAAIAVNGTSAGGGLALSLLLRLKTEGLPMPGGLAANTPWADLTGSGDSYRANEWLDNVVVSYGGYLDDAARLYAGKVNLAEPGVSPLFGDLAGLPPTLLVSGTRDLFLSDSARVQRKLRRAGVTAELQLFEGQSHGQYLFDPAAPETREIFVEIARFLDAHLSQ